MKLKLLLAACVLATGIGGLTNARTQAAGIAEVIPASAHVAVVIQNLNAINTKLQTMARMISPNSTTDLFAELQQVLGITQGLNKQGSAALVWLAPPPHFIGGASQAIVAILPSLKPKTLAACFNAGAPQHGIMRGTTHFQMPIYLAAKGHYVILSNHQSLVAAALAKSTSLAAILRPTENAMLKQDDIICRFNMPRLRPAMKSFAAQAGGGLQMLPDMPPVFEQAATAALRMFSQVADDSQSIVIGLSDDDTGLNLHVLYRLTSNSSSAKLAEAQVPLGPRPLAGLPDTKFFAAAAGSINGAAIAQWMRQAVGTMPATQTKSPAAATPNDPTANILTQYRRQLALIGGFRMIVTQARHAHGLKLIEIIKSTDPAKQLHMARQWQMLNLKQGISKAIGIQTIAKMTPNAVKIAGVPFDRGEITLKLMPGKQNDIAAKRQLRTLKGFYGDHPVLLDGVVGEHLFFGLNETPDAMADAINNFKTKTDNLSTSAAIAPLTAHILTKPMLVAYLPIDQWILTAEAAARDANGLPSPAGGAATLGPPIAPMAVSAHAGRSHVMLQLFIPVATFLATVHDSQELTQMQMLGQ